MKLDNSDVSFALRLRLPTHTISELEGLAAKIRSTTSSPSVGNTTQSSTSVDEKPSSDFTEKPLTSIEPFTA